MTEEEKAVLLVVAIKMLMATPARCSLDRADQAVDSLIEFTRRGMYDNK